MSFNESGAPGSVDERFPGERRTLTGRFTGTDGRLVYVAPDGRMRDCGYPLCGFVGLDRARLGLAVGDEVEWPTEERTSQRYLGDTVAIETVHELPSGTLTRWDVTDNCLHLSRVHLDPATDVNADELSLAVVATFQPNGRETRVGQLQFEDTVEIYHTTEHDFLTAQPGFADVHGRTELPPAVRDGNLSVGQIGEHNDEDKLTGTIVGRVPFEDGTAAVASLLTRDTETTREEAQSRLAEAFGRLDTRGAFRRVGAEGTPSVDVPSHLDETVTADLRVLSLLSAPSGLRIAGPDFDPKYHHSGGYGYTWFRDDAEIASHLLDADGRLGLGLEEWHRQVATQYVALQRPDGSWPHRVWPSDGRLAPGWANSRIEDGSDVEYQADQTASVLTFLAGFRAAGFDVDGLDATLERGRNCLDATLERGRNCLDATLDEGGLPGVCQNAWEDMSGQFTHTAATFLQAYSKLARGDDVAADRAVTVYDGLDDLWCEDRGCYALRRESDGTVDERYDSATLALPAAHLAFDEIRTVDTDRLDRLVSHVESVIDGLYRETDAIAGLARYEDDVWRRHGQRSEKVWTVSTAWGVDACAHLAVLLWARDDSRAPRLAQQARDLLALVEPGGRLVEPTTYLPEQYFDDGTPDSATPLGWPHAVRTASVALLADHDMLVAESPTR